jgi:hypothetical protein
MVDKFVNDLLENSTFYSLFMKHDDDLDEIDQSINPNWG